MTGSDLEPRSPVWRDAVLASFARQGALTSIGASLEELSPGRCQVRLPFSDRVSQQHGFFHGGVIATVADTAGGYAAMSLCETGAEVLTVEFKINFVSPARGTNLLATGTVIRSGRTLIVTRADVEVIANGVRTVCATLLQTIAVREGAPSL